MSDELNTPPVPAQIEPEPTAKKGFLSTAGGKVVAIVVGLGVLGIIAGIAVAIILVVFGGQVVEEVGDQIQEQVNQSQTSTGTVAVQAEAPAADVPLSSVFTFRDIFVPLLKPLDADTAAPGTTTTTSTPDTITPTTNNTLYLDGVVTENGVLMAQLRYNGSSYTLGAGGVIPGSPWQVLRVSTTSVTMLYGDIQVTLAVGEGVTK